MRIIDHFLRRVPGDVFTLTVPQSKIPVTVEGYHHDRHVFNYSAKPLLTAVKVLERNLLYHGIEKKQPEQRLQHTGIIFNCVEFIVDAAPLEKITQMMEQRENKNARYEELRVTGERPFPAGQQQGKGGQCSQERGQIQYAYCVQHQLFLLMKTCQHQKQINIELTK